MRQASNTFQCRHAKSRFTRRAADRAPSAAWGRELKDERRGRAF